MDGKNILTKPEGMKTLYAEMFLNKTMSRGVSGLPIVMLLLGMVSTIIIVVFALQNGRIVTIGFFDWSIEASLVLVIMVSALMGFLTAIFFELFIQIKLRYRLYKMGRQLKQLEEEVQMFKKANVLSTSTPEKLAEDGAGITSAGSSTQV